MNNKIVIFFDNFRFSPKWYCVDGNNIELILMPIDLGSFSQYHFNIQNGLKYKVEEIKKYCRKKRKKELTKLAGFCGGFKLINKIKTYPLVDPLGFPKQIFTVNNRKVQIIGSEIIETPDDLEIKIVGEFLRI